MASSAPASSLIEIADPPVSNRSHPIVDKSVAQKIEDFCHLSLHRRRLWRSFVAAAAIWFQILCVRRRCDRPLRCDCCLRRVHGEIYMPILRLRHRLDSQSRRGPPGAVREMPRVFHRECEHSSRSGPGDEIRNTNFRKPGVQKSGVAECLRRLRRASGALRRPLKNLSRNDSGPDGALADHSRLRQRHSVLQQTPRQTGLEGRQR